MTEAADRLRLSVKAEDLAPAPASNGYGNGNGAKPIRTEQVPQGYPLTDTGNAERFAHWHGKDALHCGPWNKWVVWDSRRFTIDTTQEVNRRATDTVRKIHLETALLEDGEQRAKLARHAYQSENETRIRALLKRAESLLAVSPDVFDADPMLFNCGNGTVDLRTGELRAHNRDNRLTKCSPVRYDPQAKAPIWEAFLDRVMDRNARLIGFLQRLAGYCLTALTVEQVLAFLYGTGRNGKSVFINTLQYVMGDYARSTRPETLMVKHGNDIPNDIAALVGARLVATIEIDEGARLAESLVKQLTGGDKVTARFLYGENFDFRPTFKILMAGNHKPVIRGTDLAIWERILTIPFTVTIPAEERDKQLPEKLEREAPGILAWAVHGSQEWQRIGLDPPQEVRTATEEYRGEMDVLAQFLDDCCEIEAAAVTPASALYERYTDWCKASGERQWSQQLFGRRLGERGFERDRFGQTRVWQGVRLRPGSET